MPTYLYKNTNTGEIYELRQSMRDDAYAAHPETGVPVKRVLARPSIAFKGSGFYANDSRPREKSEGGSSGESKPAVKAEGGSSGKSERGSKSERASKSEGASKSKGGGEG
ncbi:FmdB family transcriptional regulator [Deinococcus frigens]|uniref:FmdB family transcriptional regulator n=1 Tax=Deinococcus frigens TaxID=249403 RepID=UPI00049809CA